MRAPLSRVLLPARSCKMRLLPPRPEISSGRSAHPTVVNSVLDPCRSGKGEILQRRLKLGKMPIASAGKAESGKELLGIGGEEIAVRPEARLSNEPRNAP
jgi:hypothetical protein